MRILVVTHYIPMPDRQADMRRLVEILRVASRDHKISLMAIDLPGQRALYTKESVATYEAQLRKLGVERLNENDAIAPGARYDVVIFEHYLLARGRIERMRFRFPHAVVVVDTVDIAYLRVAAQSGARTDDESLPPVAIAVRKEELGTYAQADIVVAISSDEAWLLRADLPGTTVHVIPLLLDIPPFAKRSPGLVHLLFVGNLTYAANVDAARLLVDRIYPRILEAIPESRLTIVGNAPPDDMTSDPSRGIEVTGFVPDLAPYYAAASISVAPLTWGGGLKGKVAEAASYGLPVVTTSIGASGFEWTDRRQALIVDDPVAFAEAVIELHNDQVLYESVRREGWSDVHSRYSRETVAAAVDALFSLAQIAEPLPLPLPRRLRLACKIAFHRHIGWRLERNTSSHLRNPTMS